MKERWKTVWSRAAPALGRAAEALGRGLALYLDDLLLLGGGMCFTLAAAEALGRAAALAAAGVCLTAYALVIARARKGGGG